MIRLWLVLFLFVFGCSSKTDNLFVVSKVCDIVEVKPMRKTYNATLVLNNEVPGQESYLFCGGKKYAVFPQGNEPHTRKLTIQADLKDIDSLKNKEVLILK